MDIKLIQLAGRDFLVLGTDILPINEIKSFDYDPNRLRIEHSNDRVLILHNPSSTTVWNWLLAQEGPK